MGDNGYAGASPRRRWRRRVRWVLLLGFVLLVAFHRPLLLGLGRQLTRYFAGREHLKLDLHLEGNIFSNLTVRNLHVAPLGPTDIEAIDVDLIHADYSLFGLMRHGFTGFFKNVELRSARVVLNPDKTPPKTRVEKPGKKKLPAIFPDRLKLSDVNLVVRNKPHDFFLQHVDLELDPRVPGALRIERLQLPDGQAWSKISASTSYAAKNLILRDLILNDQDRINVLNVDASQITKKGLEIKLDAGIGGGKLFGSAQLAAQGSSLFRKFELHGQTISADALNKYANLPANFLSGQIQKIDVDFTGRLNLPSKWLGGITAELANFRIDAIGFDRCVLKATAKDGKADLETADLVQGENHVYLHGSLQLPERVEQFNRSTGTLEMTAAALDLEQFTAGTTQPITGLAQINGKIELKNKKLEANFLASAASIEFGDNKIEKIVANLSASKIMPTAPNRKPKSSAPTTASQPWFTDLETQANLQASNIRYREYAFDSLDASISSAEDAVSLKHVNVRRKQNNLSVIGRYWLPADIRQADATTADMDIFLDAREVGDYWASDSPDKISGPLQLAAQVDWKERSANGQLSIFGSNLKMRELLFKQLSSQWSITNNVVYVNDFTASLNENDFVAAHGIVDPRSQFHYSGKIAAKISNAATLQPLLRAVGNGNELAGTLAINWEGTGDPQTIKNSGKLKLLLENGRYGNLKSLRANIDATYSPEGLDIPVIYVASGKTDFQTVIQGKGETLEITQIALNQGEAKYASGYVSIPFVWKNLGTNQPVSPANGKVIATFQSENIDIKKVFEDFGAKPPASGILNVKLDAHGTVGDLNARLDVQMRELKGEQTPKLEPATFELSAQAEHDQLVVNGKLQQAKIQPLELNANMPFDIPKIIRDRKVADETPISAKLRLPRSSVNFIRQLVPDLETLDGDLALDVDVGGKFGRPILKGNADMTVNSMRFTNSTLPALHDFKSRLNFANDAITLERFGGELAGGPFTLSGRVTFPKITEANLDLHLKADSVLVARNDAMTARTDADLKIVGPAMSANVTGTLSITNSQFLKNIDLIPIGLPGRPAPQPPASQPEFSIPQPPLRDWKFDVAIKTKDPVLIRGNLAKGGATSDLHFGGTGLHPGLEGVVRLKDVDATLPFSRLSISYGLLTFDPSDSLNPKIDMQGTSVIRDYIIHVYVYGTALQPEAVFTSEPPLPQEEIISLLATGTTREELTGNNSVLAGRAAMLLVQQLYVKIFKKGQAAESNSVFDRLDLDVGQIDPRTGQRQATARYKINDQFVVVGDVEVGGDFRGMLKYLIRFR